MLSNLRELKQDSETNNIEMIELYSRKALK